MILHPLTGEILDETNLAELVAAEKIVDAYLRGQSRHYSFRRRLREQIAELRGPAVLPKPRYQTETQHKVYDCPRCSRRVQR